jgi:tetratricopeptide (TPR) repeat protein
MNWELMSGFRRLITEIHRRSLWQVLAIYVGGAWIGYEAIQGLTEGLGLPEWFPGFAVVLFIVGLPIVLATAFVHEGGLAQPKGETSRTAPTGPAREAQPAPPAGHTSDEPETATASGGIRRILTWRNSLLAGVIVFAVWGAVSATWILLTVPGLVVKAEAADFFSRKDKVVVAAFENQTDQPALELAVREAIITDLEGSDYVDVLDRTEIKEVLDRMRLPDTMTITEDIALEIARREGYPAVIAGGVTPLGSGFQISARVIEASGGEAAVRVRETAASETDVVASVEKLSRLLRRHLGEKLTSLQHSQPLPQVTTASLPALELYARAVEYGHRGQQESAIPLLEQAVALDTSFATAYRALSIYHGNLGNVAAGQRYVSQAYAHFDRLAARERYLVAALYHAYLYRLDSAAYYYELEIERDSGSFVAVNNLADIYERMGRYEDAAPLYRRAVELERDRASVWVNLASIARTLGDTAGADSSQAVLEAEYPGTASTLFNSVANAVYMGDFEAAEVRARKLTSNTSLAAAGWGHWYLSSVAALRGDVDGALAQADTAIQLGGESGVTLIAYLALENVQHALLAAGAPQRARSYLEKIEAMAFGETTPFAGYFGLTLVAEGYALAGNLAEADRFLQHADSITRTTRFHPTGFEEHVRAIEALQSGDIEAGITHLERARANAYGLLRRKSRLLLADAEAAAGRLDVAAANYDSLTSSLRMNWTEVSLYGPLLPLAHERAANAYLELGDTARAAKHLAAFIDCWRDADPELQPRVESANRLLQRLVRDR